MFDSTGRIVCNPIEHVDDWTHVHVEAGFLLHFTDNSPLKRFAELDPSAWQAPLPFQRFVRAFDEQHAIAIEDHRPDAEDRP